MPDDINCQIEECNFNDQVGGCRATNIEVRTNVKDKKARASRNTSCETFVPR
ncbi:MAG: DUF1540 domain-containing protein [Clostridia bacterium]|jgi:hypothetical protein|nr:DUF1540 domain-containing protein [Clostridia bacterium]